MQFQLDVHRDRHRDTVLSGLDHPVRPSAIRYRIPFHMQNTVHGIKLITRWRCQRSQPARQDVLEERSSARDLLKQSVTERKRARAFYRID